MRIMRFDNTVEVESAQTRFFTYNNTGMHLI